MMESYRRGNARRLERRDSLAVAGILLAVVFVIVVIFH